MEHPYAFDVYDICGTSYAPFPLDEPKFKRRTRGTKLLSSFGSHDRCSARPGHSVERPVCGSPEWLFACLSRWPTSAVA
jgi:hypothetical protein